MSRIFYIYNEAAGAVFLTVCALIEFGCGAALGGPIQTWIANPAGGLFMSFALASVWYIIRTERHYTSSSAPGAIRARKATARTHYHDRKPSNLRTGAATRRSGQPTELP